MTGAGGYGVFHGPSDPRIREAMDRLSDEARAIVEQYSRMIPRKTEPSLDDWRRLYEGWAAQ